jgi:uncharacterized protein (DUF2267 family)
MQYGEIIDRIQKLSGLTDSDQIAGVLRAVLGTLGESIYRTGEDKLAAQLPKELRDVFQEYQPRERGRGDLANYPVEEFYNRVKARANISYQDSQRLSAIVLNVLKEAVSEGGIEAVKKELPASFQKMFEEEVSGPHEELPPFAERNAEEFHIFPREDRKWNVQTAEGLVIATFDTKEQAIVHADDLADADRGDFLVIHNIDGSISKKMEHASREVTGD